MFGLNSHIVFSESLSCLHAKLLMLFICEKCSTLNNQLYELVMMGAFDVSCKQAALISSVCLL
jgi:hypothetical protein